MFSLTLKLNRWYAYCKLLHLVIVIVFYRKTNMVTVFYFVISTGILENIGIGFVGKTILHI